MVTGGTHLAGKPLQDGQVLSMLCQRPEPPGQIMTIEVSINRLLALLTLHRLFIKTRGNAHPGPQTVASVHEDKSCWWSR